MKEEHRLFIKIYTKRDLSEDELVDAFREAGVLIDDSEKISHDMVRVVTCSNNPIAMVDFFQEKLDEVKNVVGSQFKIMRGLD